MSYNGWKNYETWLVGLWIDNEPGTYEAAQDIARMCRHKSALQMGEAIRDWYRELLEECDQWPQTGVVADLLNAAWHDVDWEEIGEHYLADQSEDEDETETVEE